MLLREVSIGRSKDSDIYLDDKCIYASTHHATIYYDGTQLMYRDRSSNGTMINNVSVKHRAVPIKQGDIIMVAGKYQINWSQINSFFPNDVLTARPAPQPTVSAAPAVEPTYVDTSKWNWGAFSLYPIWGLFNGCWWGILVGFFLGCFFPIPNIVFGVYGTRWAWENKMWRSAEDFEHTQHNWAIAGIIIFVLNILSILFVTIPYIAFMASL